MDGHALDASVELHGDGATGTREVAVLGGEKLRRDDRLGDPHQNGTADLLLALVGDADRDDADVLYVAAGATNG